MPTPASPLEIELGVIILGAGASTRMGRPKLLLPWGRTSIVGHLISQWQTLRARQIAVVCAAHDPTIPCELDRIAFSAENRITNLNPQRGMFSSICSAARWSRWKPNLSHWVIVLGDQPHLRTETLRALIRFAAARPSSVCQPSRQGRRRHPVILPRAIFQNLTNSTDDNLKSFLQDRPQDLAACEMNDPGLDLDIDRPEDYEKALQIGAAETRSSEKSIAEGRTDQ